MCERNILMFIGVIFTLKYLDLLPADFFYFPRTTKIAVMCFFMSLYFFYTCLKKVFFVDYVVVCIAVYVCVVKKDLRDI